MLSKEEKLLCGAMHFNTIFSFSKRLGFYMPNPGSPLKGVRYIIKRRRGERERETLASRGDFIDDDEIPRR